MVATLNNQFLMVGNQLDDDSQSLHRKWLEITISIHFLMVVWGSRNMSKFTSKSSLLHKNKSESWIIKSVAKNSVPSKRGCAISLETCRKIPDTTSHKGVGS